ncbi:MAG: hypothetical protein HY063_09340 [Bacteroidetes bacterium]|nr:hypothetical protein [Bacteroidota bacterium]
MTNKEFLEKLGMEIKVSRIRKGLQRKDVSKITGLCYLTIQEIENGKSDGKILSYKRIADAIEIELKNFL